jgi:hypothetical protein
MMLWVVFKLEISYRLIIYLEGFWLFFERGFFEDCIFCMVKYLSVHNSSFALRYFDVNENARMLYILCLFMNFMYGLVVYTLVI